MLVLSRQRDETIMIGDDIEITVVDIRGDKVRLGINAPKWVQVHRKEVYLAIKRENERAANIRPNDLPGAGAPPGTTPPGSDRPKRNGGENAKSPGNGGSKPKADGLRENKGDDRAK